MHPLLLFTLFFISGNFPTSLSSSIKRNLEYSYKTKDSDGTYPLRENIAQDKTEQSKPNMQVKYNGKEQTVYIPLNSGSNSGFIKYYTSYNEQSHKCPNTVIVKSVYQNSMTPTYNNGYPIPKRNTDCYNKYKVAYVENQNKPLINNKNSYLYRTSFTRSEPLKTDQIIGKPNKKELGKANKPFKRESSKSDGSKSVFSYKTKENFNSEEQKRGKNSLWDESDAEYFNDDTFDNEFDDLSNEKDKINAEKNKNNIKIKNNEGIKTIDDKKSISSHSKNRNDDSDSKENKSIDELNKSKKSEVKFKENVQKVVRKPRTDTENESLLNSRKIEFGDKNFYDKSKLSTLTATTASTITPLQIPRNELESVTEQYIPLHTTTKPSRDNNQDSHDISWNKPKEDPYPGFITKLIEPLMRNLRNML